MISREMVAGCEVLAGLAVVLQFVLPRNLDIGFRVSPQLTIGLPMRSLVPLLLIAIAGLASVVTLTKTFWALTHHQ